MRLLDQVPRAELHMVESKRADVVQQSRVRAQQAHHGETEWAVMDWKAILYDLTSYLDAVTPDTRKERDERWARAARDSKTFAMRLVQARYRAGMDAFDRWTRRPK